MTVLSEFLEPARNVLVISACSAKKQISDLPKDHLPTARELDDPALRAKNEARLARYALPAGELYLGEGHKYVQSGIQELRHNGYWVSHYILSAGYGLVGESDIIVPYNETFRGKTETFIRTRGQQLGLSEKLITLSDKQERLIVILGREYLEAIGLPFDFARLARILVYVAPSFAKRLGTGVSIITVGEVEARKLGVYPAFAKEKMFQNGAHDALNIGSPA